VLPERLITNCSFCTPGNGCKLVHQWNLNVQEKKTPSDHSSNANLELCMCACVRVQSIETNLIRVERCAPDRHSLTVASQRWCVETARDTSKFGQVLCPSKQEKIAIRFTRTKLHCKYTSNLISDSLFVREL
jgi:hypothetical protein